MSCEESLIREVGRACPQSGDSGTSDARLLGCATLRQHAPRHGLFPKNLGEGLCVCLIRLL